MCMCCAAWVHASGELFHCTGQLIQTEQIKQWIAAHRATLYAYFGGLLYEWWVAALLAVPCDHQHWHHQLKKTEGALLHIMQRLELWVPFISGLREYWVQESQRWNEVHNHVVPFGWKICLYLASLIKAIKWNSW